jgi:hypothetical protein
MPLRRVSRVLPTDACVTHAPYRILNTSWGSNASANDSTPPAASVRRTHPDACTSYTRDSGGDGARSSSDTTRGSEPETRSTRALRAPASR